jgi:hypothetical protein
MTAPAGWSITTPAVGGTGTVTSTIATLAPGSAAFTLVVNVDAGTPDGTVISNTATVAATSGDNDQTNNSATENTPVGDLATIVVQLEVDPAPDAQDFVFTDTIPGCNIGTLDDDNNGSRPNSATCAAPIGSYSVSQAVVSGYGLDVDCSDPDGGTSVTGNSASIDLDAAETVTCVFENQRQGDDGTPLLPTAAPTSTPTQQPSPRPAPTQTPAPGASVAGIQPPSTGDGGVSRQAGLSSLLILGVPVTLAVVGLRVAGSRRRL